MNKTMIGALIVAMALLPSFASAATTAYLVDEDDFEIYEVSGSLLVVPTLDQDEGSAAITSANFNSGTMKWTVRVDCLDSSTGRCTGDIVH